MATYARADAVDVRISAIAEHGADGRLALPADELVDEAEAIVLAALGRYVWGRDDDTWPGAIGRRLEELRWTLAVREVGTGYEFMKPANSGVATLTGTKDAPLSLARAINRLLSVLLHAHSNPSRIIYRSVPRWMEIQANN